MQRDEGGEAELFYRGQHWLPSSPSSRLSIAVNWLPTIIPALEKRLNFVAGFRICWLPSPCGCWLAGLCTTILVDKEPFSITTLARAEVFWSVLVLWRRHHFEGLSRGEKTDVSFYCLPFTIDTSLVGFGPIDSMA